MYMVNCKRRNQHHDNFEGAKLTLVTSNGAISPFLLEMAKIYQIEMWVPRFLIDMTDIWHPTLDNMAGEVNLGLLNLHFLHFAWSISASCVKLKASNISQFNIGNYDQNQLSSLLLLILHELLPNYDRKKKKKKKRLPLCQVHLLEITMVPGAPF